MMTIAIRVSFLSSSALFVVIGRRTAILAQISQAFEANRQGS